MGTQRETQRHIETETEIRETGEKSQGERGKEDTSQGPDAPPAPKG